MSADMGKSVLAIAGGFAIAVTVVGLGGLLLARLALSIGLGD